MLNNLQKRKSEGFTIIEVMIVLAIAGLIMLIVFLAVPALQRNSRNTQYKADASAYAAAVGEYMQSHDGNVPAVGDLANIAGLSKVSKSTEPTTITNNGQAATVVTTAGTLVINTNAKCSDTNIGASVTTTRAVAILYGVETSGGVTQQCVDAS